MNNTWLSFPYSSIVYYTNTFNSLQCTLTYYNTQYVEFCTLNTNNNSSHNIMTSLHYVRM